MNSDKNFSRKFKEGISPQQLENLARKHTQEVFSSFAIFIGTISSMFDFFTGAEFSIFFAAIGTIIGLLFSHLIDVKMKTFYEFIINQEKNVEMLLGGVKIVIALFLPFIFFGFVGILAGLSYHYYIKQSQIRHVNDSEGHT